MRQSPRPDIFDDFHKMVLNNIAVKKFSVNKVNTGFKTSNMIHWEVDGPETGFELLLNDRIISKGGAITVQPGNVSTYQLKAKMGKYCRLLSSITPDTEAKRWNLVEQFLNMNILALSVQAIASNPHLAFRKKITNATDLLPQDKDIQFCGTRIFLRLPVKIKMLRLPNAFASIFLSFDISEKGDRIFTEKVKISIKIRYAFLWKMMIPGNRLNKKLRSIYHCIHHLTKRIEFLLNKKISKERDRDHQYGAFGDGIKPLTSATPMNPGNDLKMASIRTA